MRITGPPHRSSFVGREAELAVLLQRLEGAGGREGGVALVAGEPGIGKTRLLAELADRARAEGWTVLTGRGSEGEGMPPYLPVVEALRQFLRTAPPDQLGATPGPATSDLARLVLRCATMRACGAAPMLERAVGFFTGAAPSA